MSNRIRVPPEFDLTLCSCRGGGPSCSCRGGGPSTQAPSTRPKGFCSLCEPWGRRAGAVRGCKPPSPCKRSTTIPPLPFPPTPTLHLPLTPSLLSRGPKGGQIRPGSPAWQSRMNWGSSPLASCYSGMQAGMANPPAPVLGARSVRGPHTGTPLVHISNLSHPTSHIPGLHQRPSTLCSVRVHSTP